MTKAMHEAEHEAQREAEQPVRQGTKDRSSRPSSPTAVRVALLIVLFGFVTLASIVAFKTPAWEAPDEPGHIQNIETLVSGHWYGFNPGCRPNPEETILSCSGDEAHQAPLYYLLLAGWQTVVGQHAQPPPVHSLVFGRDDGSHTEFFVHHPDRALVLWLRIADIAMGAATVIMTFLAARLVARDVWTPVVAAAVLAFLPRFVFLSASVTNDNLVILLGAVLTYCALRYTKDVSTRWMIVTGAVFGLLVTTKLSVLPLALLMPLLALFGPSWRRRFSLLAWGTVSALSVCSWYLIQNWVRYGDPLARHESTIYLTRIGALGVPMGKPYIVKDPLNLVLNDVPKRIVTNFWYSSGWGQFHWPVSVGALVTVGVLALLVGFVYQRIPVRVLLVLGTISALSLACVWLLAFQTGTYGDRYAYVGITAIAAIVALAVQGWPLFLRWLLPAAGLLGCLLAIHSDVLGVHWTA
jgi:hypothetical protein